MRREPNVIYILADDLGYGDVSCLNEMSRLQTPNLDRIAAEGMRLTDAHASSALCTPSRYSILTGRYNWRSVLKESVLKGYGRPILEPGRMTVASLLRERGYFTACVGKWHLGLEWPLRSGKEEDVDYTLPIRCGPTHCGFDYFYGISASLDMPPYVYIENDQVTQIPDRMTQGPDAMRYWRQGETAPDFRHEEVLPKLTDKVLDLIDEKKDAPFFLYFALPSPHTPILPSPEFEGKSKTNLYGDFVLMTDAVVGRVLDKLAALGLAEDTIVVFTSDNGCSPAADLPALAKCGHNPSYIFRGHKADIYEGGHRVPYLVRWPREIVAGLVSEETVCLSDLLATLAEIIDTELPADAGEDSVSNLGVWQGRSSGPLREATVHHSCDGSFAIRQGRWKLELCPGSGGWSDPKPGEEPADAPKFQLYDLDADIGERRNLIGEQPEVAARLRDLLKCYIESGRSTPGARQSNTTCESWPQIWWTDNALYSEALRPTSH